MPDDWPDPASRGSCFLGGNLAECSGGPRAVKYGVTKDYIMGVEAVLPNAGVARDDVQASLDGARREAANVEFIHRALRPSNGARPF